MKLKAILENKSLHCADKMAKYNEYIFATFAAIDTNHNFSNKKIKCTLYNKAQINFKKIYLFKLN